MYLERLEDGCTYLTINKKYLKKQIGNVAGNLLGWIAAGIGTVTLMTAVYYGNVAYQFLTTLF